MITKKKKNDRLVRKLRKVLDKVQPDELKLSPITVMEMIEEAEEKEIEVLELEMEDDGEISKHICFKGIPVILCIKFSHNMRKLAFA